MRDRASKFRLVAGMIACGVIFSNTDVCGAEAARRPNIVFLLSDDQRPDTIGALGNPAIHTPNLDRIARTGVVFTRAISPNPLCVPSRKEIFSGCCGIRNGVVNFGGNFDPDQIPLPRVLQQAGYHTWYVGKWHTAGRPSHHGFAESAALYAGGGGKVPPGVDHAGRPVTGYRGWVLQTDDGQRFPERGVGLTPDISRTFADAAIGLIRRQSDQPFFLHVNFAAPHDPLLIPPGYEGRYDPDQIPLPPNFLPEHPFDHGNFRGRDELLFEWPRTPDEVRRELAAYYAVISDMDEQIGRIFEALEQTDQAANTVVIFASDHGLAIGSHGLRGKQNMYDHTIITPLLMCGPVIPPGAHRETLCYLRDLYPTICELAGAEVPEVVQAKSLLPVIAGKTQSLYPAVFGYFSDAQRMIRTDRWKLIHYPKIDQYQLFDLDNDPFELKNLVADPSHANQLAVLQSQLRTWQDEVGDPVAAPTR